MPISNPAADLLSTAELYLALGWSVIPLRGSSDPANPKAPAVPWKPFQSRLPTSDELHSWFIDSKYSALGIVTGSVSRLAILDFDNPALFARFSRQFPDLAETGVVKTRRGYHIYFRVPPHLNLSTRKGQGVDLLWEGCYAVARPSIIDGFAYHAVTGGHPKLLTVHDLRRIYTFLDGLTPVQAPAQTVLPVERPPVLTSDDLAAVYRFHVQQGTGRNHALFNACLLARDQGWTQGRVSEVLVNLHVHTLPMSTHASESQQSRQQEAFRTLQSAFSRPARPARQLNPFFVLALPANVCETLHDQGQSSVVRVLAGLRGKGIQPGQRITRQQMDLLLKGRVGRDSLDAALKACTPSGQPLFERALPPSGHPLAPDGAAADPDNTPPIKCFFGRVQKSGKIRRGRKEHVYIMPSNSDLCRKLGVKHQSADPISLDDVSSARKTRIAAYREFLKRCPGQYSRRWLAARLGVSVRTLHSYSRELGVTVQAMYHETPVTWASLNHIPDEPLDGTFLEDESGNRYPPQQGIAAKLLKGRHTLLYKRQTTNFYSLEAPHVALAQVWERKQAVIQQQERVRQWVNQASQPEKSAPSIPKTPNRIPPVLPEKRQSGLRLSPGMLPTVSRAGQGRVSKRRYRHPLPDEGLEKLAQRLCDTVNSRSANSTQHISQFTARKLVEAYDKALIEHSLCLVAQRQNITCPAGFLITVLRSESALYRTKKNKY